jgi:hypothetical protein
MDTGLLLDDLLWENTEGYFGETRKDGWSDQVWCGILAGSKVAIFELSTYNLVEHFVMVKKMPLSWSIPLFQSLNHPEKISLSVRGFVLSR